MPIYVYRCQQCGSTIERRQSFSDAPLTSCEDCSGELRRVLQPVGIIFKGNGFYVTDNRSSTNGAHSSNGHTAESSTSASSESSASAATNTKSTAGGSSTGESKSAD